MADSDIVKLNLRLPKSLHRHLVQIAKRNKTSLNMEILAALERDRRERPVTLNDFKQLYVEATQSAISATAKSTADEIAKLISGPQAGAAPPLETSITPKSDAKR